MSNKNNTNRPHRDTVPACFRSSRQPRALPMFVRGEKHCRHRRDFKNFVPYVDSAPQDGYNGFVDSVSALTYCRTGTRQYATQTGLHTRPLSASLGCPHEAGKRGE